MNDTCIRLRALSKTFDPPASSEHPVIAVDGVDLTIRRGEIVALLGPNGAGKTTTLDMVLGFTEPSSGAVEVFESTPSAAIADGRVAAVLQTGGLLRDLTVRETVELIASTHREPRSVDSVIGQAGLADIAEQQVQLCSGGEQQRLRFALALLGDPDLLVLDEPTTGMDVQARHEFWAAMRLEAAEGRTIVFATHYLQEAEDFADRTVLMAQGRIVADGPTAEVRRRASGRRIRARFENDQIDRAASQVSSYPHVHDVAIEHESLVIQTSESDEIAQLILGPLGGTDLGVAPASLEAAFLQLTSTEGANR